MLFFFFSEADVILPPDPSRVPFMVALDVNLKKISDFHFNSV